MAQTNCLKAFSDGERERVSYPLRQGRYKLEEHVGTLGAWLLTLSMVRDYVRGQSRCVYLGRCMAVDKHMWLKRLPLDIAFSLGYNLLPSLLALKNEGHVCVDDAYPRFRAACLQLLDELELVRGGIQKDISIEYTQMKRGGSLLEPLLLEAQVLFKQARAIG